MSTFKLWIHTDNAAFDDESKQYEIARILRDIADKVESNGVNWNYKTIFDYNGNDVGRYAEKDGNQ